MAFHRVFGLTLAAGLLLALGSPLVAADDPPVVGEMDCGEAFQTGNCRTECNGDFPCCYYHYIAGIESFYWCAV